MCIVMVYNLWLSLYSKLGVNHTWVRENYEQRHTTLNAVMHDCSSNHNSMIKKISNDHVHFSPEKLNGNVKSVVSTSLRLLCS